MILTGISDEAGQSIDSQIRAQKQLGWDSMELRLVDGKNAAGDLPNDEFEAVAEKILTAGMNVTCFASAIGNWSRNIKDDFSKDVKELETALGRMKRFGTKFIRTMSWVGEGAEEDYWRDETIKRYKELTAIAEDADIYLAHENCTGWAGLSPENTRQLIEEVASDNLIVLFDTGNNVAHGYDPWQYYMGLKELIRYVHIKDCLKNPAGGESSDYTYPGEGDGLVRETLTDLIGAGYEGVISIEPHVATVIHKQGGKADPEQTYQAYVKYGQMLKDMVAEIVTGK